MEDVRYKAALRWLSAMLGVGLLAMGALWLNIVYLQQRVDQAQVTNLSLAGARTVPASQTVAAAGITVDTTTTNHLDSKSVHLANLHNEVLTWVQHQATTTALNVQVPAVSVDLTALLFNTQQVLDGTLGLVDLAPDVLAALVNTLPTITSLDILDGTIDAVDIATGSITTLQLADSSVAAAKIAPGAVQAIAIASGAIGSLHLQDGTVATSDISPGAIVTSLLAAGSVASSQLQAGSVTSAALQDGAVRTDTILDETISTADIASGAISNVLLAANSIASANLIDGTIATADITTGAITSVLIGDGSIISGDIAANTILSSNIFDGTVSGLDIANNAIGSSQISDGTIATSDIATGAITATLLADDSINSSKIIDGAISASDIAASAVGATQLAASAVTTPKLSPAANKKVVAVQIGDIAITVLSNVERTAFVAPTNGTITKVSFVNSVGITAGINKGTLSVERKTAPAQTVASVPLTSVSLSAFTPNEPTLLAGTSFLAGDVYSFKYDPGILGVALTGMTANIEYVSTE